MSGKRRMTFAGAYGPGGEEIIPPYYEEVPDEPVPEPQPRKERVPNNLEIRAVSRPAFPVAIGAEVELYLNGTRIDYWQNILIDLSHDSFVTAEISIGIAGLHIEADAVLALLKAAGKVTINEEGEIK